MTYPTRRQQRRRPVRSPQRRNQARPNASRRVRQDVINVAADYAAVRRDLRSIAFWATLLFAVMFVLMFFI